MGRLGKKRLHNIRKANKIIFIYCEGGKTEPLYFEGFNKDLENKIRRKQILIVVEGTGRNTQSLVDYAIRKLPNHYDPEVDEKWLVFDEDTVRGGAFDNAIKKARQNKWKVAYSNECFELWYLLHFSYYDAGSGRNIYYEKVVVELNNIDPTLKIRNWRKDGKSVDRIYDILKAKQSVAIRNAKKLIASYNGKNIPLSRQKPSTKVHLLVEALNKLM